MPSEPNRDTPLSHQTFTRSLLPPPSRHSTCFVHLRVCPKQLGAGFNDCQPIRFFSNNCGVNRIVFAT